VDIVSIHQSSPSFVTVLYTDQALHPSFEGPVKVLELLVLKCFWRRRTRFFTETRGFDTRKEMTVLLGLFKESVCQELGSRRAEARQDIISNYFSRKHFVTDKTRYFLDLNTLIMKMKDYRLIGSGFRQRLRVKP